MSLSLKVMAIIFSILVYFIFCFIKESILFSYVKIMLYKIISLKATPFIIFSSLPDALRINSKFLQIVYKASVSCTLACSLPSSPATETFSAFYFPGI